MQTAQVVVFFITQRLDGTRPVMEFRAVPNRVNQPPLQEKFGENKIVLAKRSPHKTSPPPSNGQALGVT
jgi:hypothetical protein